MLLTCSELQTGSLVPCDLLPSSKGWACRRLLLSDSYGGLGQEDDC